MRPAPRRLGSVTSLRNLLDRPSPLLKQAPSLAAIVVALLLTVLVPGMPVAHTLLIGLGAGLIFAATGFAAWMSLLARHDGFLVLLIPMVDIIGFGLFRSGTGGVGSLFSSLMLIPVVWLATAPGLRYVFFVAVLTSTNYILTFFSEPPKNWVEWLRGIIAPLVFASIATVINELSRQQRLRAEEAEHLVEERTRALNLNLQMVDQLQKKEQEFRGLLESFESLWESITAQAILATDTDGKVQAWTPGAERLYGLTSEEAVGQVTVDRFFPGAAMEAAVSELPVPIDGGSHAESLTHEASSEHSELHPAIRAMFAAADATSLLEIDILTTTADGHTVPARVTITQRRDGYGELLGYLLVITDESRAAEVVRMKDEFVGMVSHELRTPLSSIIGFLDLLKDDPEQPLSAEQLGFVEVIERNANRLLSLVSDLLFTAQVESGSFPLSISPYDVNEGIAIALQSAQPNAERNMVTLDAELPEQHLMIQADPTRIDQAIDNLISNAIKFTPQGGSVTIGAQAKGDSVELWVRDTGFGIPKREQEMLFTRFFRASTATKNAVPGIGLGLTIIRAIVTAHGGTLSVASVEGEGTEFCVLLPKTPGQATAS